MDIMHGSREVRMAVHAPNYSMRGMGRCLVWQDLSVRENRSPVEASCRCHGVQHHGGRAVYWNHDNDSPIPGKLLLDSSLELRQSDCPKRRFDQLKRSG